MINETSFTYKDFERINDYSTIRLICSIMNGYGYGYNDNEKQNHLQKINGHKQDYVDAIMKTFDNVGAERALYGVIIANGIRKSTNPYYSRNMNGWIRDGVYYRNNEIENVLMLPDATAFLESIPDDELKEYKKTHHYYVAVFCHYCDNDPVSTETILSRPVKFVDELSEIRFMTVSKYGKTTAQMRKLYDDVWKLDDGKNGVFDYLTNLISRAENHKIEIDRHCLNRKFFIDNMDYPDEFKDELAKGSTTLVNKDDYEKKIRSISRKLPVDDRALFNDVFRLNRSSGLKASCTADFILKHEQLINTMNMSIVFNENMPNMQMPDTSFIKFNNDYTSLMKLIVPSGTHKPVEILKTFELTFKSTESARRLGAFTWMRVIMMMFTGNIENKADADDMKTFESWMVNGSIPVSWNGHELTDTAHDLMIAVESSDEIIPVIIRRMAEGMNGLEKKLIQHMISND